MTFRSFVPSVLFGFCVAGDQAFAQGCVPSRFASPATGSKGDVYLPSKTWQIGVGYRRIHSTQRVQGRTVMSVLPNGRAPNAVTADLVDVSIAYGVSDRFSLTLNTPMSQGHVSAWFPDNQRHENDASGLGDMTLIGRFWLRDANPMQPGGNLSLGIGVKAPTGQAAAGGSYWKADGTQVPLPVHVSISRSEGRRGREREEI